MPENERKLGSDLARVDAHVIQPHEYDELPELTEADLARSVERLGGAAAGPALPDEARQSQITLRLDDDVIAYFRGLGDGWQGRINKALRDAAHLKARG